MEVGMSNSGRCSCGHKLGPDNVIGFCESCVARGQHNAAKAGVIFGGMVFLGAAAKYGPRLMKAAGEAAKKLL